MACTFCPIKDLELNLKSIFLNVLIIGKTEKRIFRTNKSGVITLTVRDSKNHFINCTIWGTDSYLTNCDKAFKIGDVIAIYMPTVVQKNINSPYNPRTTSRFELTINEGKQVIHRLTDAPKRTDLIQLRNQSFKSTSLALLLSDLADICETELFADVVVLVRSVEPIKYVQTKNGQKTTRKVYLMDVSTESMVMSVWHAEIQERMNHWKPMETILHLVDVRAAYSTFEKALTLSIVGRTLILENPVHSSRSNEILAYIHGLSVEKVNSLKLPPTPSYIAEKYTNVMNVRKILREIVQNPYKEFGAIVKAVITKFDINDATVKSCMHCKKILYGQQDCGKTACGAQTNGPRHKDKVYMRVNIADNTGTLKCKITDESAQIVLGHTAQGLKQLSETVVDNIFEEHILGRFAVTVQVRPISRTDYFASILSIKK